MALVQPALAASLTQVLGTPGQSAPQKAQEWAGAYNLYAMPAQAATLLPVFVGVEQAAFMARLLPVFTNYNSTIYQFANALAGAVETFWLLPPVPFAGPGQTGAVSLFPGKPVLVASLVSILSSQYPRHEPVAQSIASALDVATRTVVVAFGPPPGTAPLV
jgi:hypothetical protein